jgi:hypothetical protein
LDLLLIMLFTGHLGWGLYGIALASMVTVIAKNVIFLPAYVARQIHQPIGPFLMAPLSATGAAAIIGGLSYSLSKVYVISSWVRLGVVGAVAGLICLAVIYFGLLNQRERSLIQSLYARFVSA